MSEPIDQDDVPRCTFTWPDDLPAKFAIQVGNHDADLWPFRFDPMHVHSSLAILLGDA